MVKPTGNKNQSAGSNFCCIENCIMVIFSLTKNKRNLNFYYLFLKTGELNKISESMVKAKITSFLRLILIPSLIHAHFFRMLDNPCSLNVLNSECLSIWDCSWLLTVYLFSWNLKTVCKSPYKYKSIVSISNYFQLENELYC